MTPTRPLADDADATGLGDDGPGRGRYFALQRLARGQRRDTQALLTRYALEGVLARLAAGHLRDVLLLKGGMLLGAFALRRSTRDIDLHLLDLPGEVEAFRSLVTEIVAHPIPDGLSFTADPLAARPIRGGSGLGGARITLTGRLHSARIPVSIDVTAGDPVWPGPQIVTIDRLLDDAPIELLGHPLPTVLAEKLATAMQLGRATTRWRDLADLHLLTGARVVEEHDVRTALEHVLAHRGVEPARIEDVLMELPRIAQSRWVTWLDQQELHGTVPPALAQVVRDLSVFTGPLLDGSARGMTWEPGIRRWVVPH